MAILKEKKTEIFNQFKQHETDSGSTHVQVALLTENIKSLTEHCRTHKKDNSARRGLIIMVSTRRKFLKYLQRTNIEQYSSLVQSLGLKK